MAKNRMSKQEIAVAFAALVDRANERNLERKKQKAIPEVRFMPMKHERKDKLQEFGLYDYKTKRYTLGSIHSGKAAKILSEIRTMLEKE